MAEQARVELLARVLAHADPRQRLGIGDDAALLDASGTLVVSVDCAVENVHFRRGWLSWQELGFKACMAAASDLAAMGARPLGLLASLVLPSWFDDAMLEQLARGQAEASELLGAPVVGGNLSSGATLSIHTTVLGEAPAQPLRRDAARPGDRLYLAGEVGLAAAGLRALESGQADRAPLADALQAWRRPQAQIVLGQALAQTAPAERAHAAIDISDGLALDASRIALASDCCVLLDAAALVSEPLRRCAAELGCDPLTLALYGGEDYVVLAAAPAAIEQAIEGTPVGAGLRRIGWVEAAAGVAMETRLWLSRGGERTPLEARGWDHDEQRAMLES